jgi:hypothetical protein
MPLSSPDQGRIADDLKRGRFEDAVQLAQSLFLADSKKAVELIGRRGFVGNLEDVVVEGFGVLER